MQAVDQAQQNAAGAPAVPQEAVAPGADVNAKNVNVGVSVPYQSASLYVGDLHPTVSESLLYDIFNAVGPVASVRVCRDAVTRKSLGYAYVNFHNPSDAERALDTMNYTLIKKKPCRMMWSHRDPSVRKNGDGNVFVKHLDPSIDNKALYDTFSLFGNILSCKVVVDDLGKSRGYGFVHFETVEAADAAIEKINGMIIAGKEVFVGKFLKKQDRPVGREWTNLYVRNLPKYFNEADLKSLFAKYGDISSSTVMTDAEGNGKGFGFVDFEGHASAVKALEEMNEYELKGKPEEEKEKENGDENSGEPPAPKIYKLEVFKAQKKSDRVRELSKKFEELKLERQAKYDGVNLYVKNLDETVDDERLEKEFAPFGTITSAKVMKSGDVSKGFGFVCYSNSEEALRAVTEMNSKMIAGKPIYVALAQRKDQRKVQLEAQHRQQQRMLMLGQGAGGMNMMNHQLGMTPQVGMNPNMMMMQQQQQQPNSRLGQQNVNPMQYFNGVPGMMPQDFPKQGEQPEMPQMKFGSGLDLQTLNQMDPEMRMRTVGERLYTLVSKMNPGLAPKITGMLLEMDNSEIVHMLDNFEYLSSKVVEASSIIGGSVPGAM
eukprot:augustus_masked-scaffold_13-processed-gene-0.8-mRNA-1 protein AED:0.04 eAED:0.05 QI:0/-1/0/1/-1/1/1/0/600